MLIDGDLSPDAIADDRTRHLARWWHDRRARADAVAGLPPVRAIDPVDLWSWLGQIALIAAPGRGSGEAAITERDLIFRLVGTRIIERLGNNCTHRSVATLESELGCADGGFGDLRAAIDRRRPVYQADRWQTFNERHARLYVHRLILPFADADGRVTRLAVYLNWTRQRPAAVPADVCALNDDAPLAAIA